MATEGRVPAAGPDRLRPLRREQPDPVTPVIVTFDDQFLEVGELVPEFGGLYLKGDALMIVVKGLDRINKKQRKAKQAEPLPEVDRRAQRRASKPSGLQMMSRFGR